MNGYSGHLGLPGLVRFAQGCGARKVVLVHGELWAKQMLARVMGKSLEHGCMSWGVVGVDRREGALHWLIKEELPSERPLYS
ncbi:MBL fold metallo-hydrolase RNA specificity domain-containing protein [Pseudomonas maumuensis]|uniref:MBL fold metallo-hydrolase RNA specificity domain-containing protein n=1 Tax=Pseudomonas maumuensis TaxID=2842354 RepID=UPI003461B421